MSMIAYPGNRSITPAPRRLSLRSIGITLLWLLGALLVVVLALPIPLLFVATAVPFYLSLTLAVIDLGLLVSLFWFERTALLVGGIVLGVILISVMAVWLSQLYTATPPITDAEGKSLPNSIASLEKVRLGGVDQWLIIRGQSVDKPVLLFLFGGPGGSDAGRVLRFNQELEKHFVVVLWEQRGCGKSYFSIGANQDTSVNRYVSDVVELSEMLRIRFHEEKIYLIGHSSGTIIGTRAIQQRPDLFYAYVGAGQIVSVRETGQTIYKMLLANAEKTGDIKYAKELNDLGEPPYFGSNPFLKYMRVHGQVYGIFEEPYVKSERYKKEGGVPELVLIPEYGWLDRVGFVLGSVYTFNKVISQLQDFDFRKDALDLKVPVYFMLGRHDVSSNYWLAEDYFEKLQAPSKELFMFEDSGHFMLWQETDKFHDIMVNKVLAETYQP